MVELLYAVSFDRLYIIQNRKSKLKNLCRSSSLMNIPWCCPYEFERRFHKQLFKYIWWINGSFCHPWFQLTMRLDNSITISNYKKVDHYFQRLNWESLGLSREGVGYIGNGNHITNISKEVQHSQFNYSSKILHQ
jgi:hypothetical protein